MTNGIENAIQLDNVSKDRLTTYYLGDQQDFDISSKGPSSLEKSKSCWSPG